MECFFNFIIINKFKRLKDFKLCSNLFSTVSLMDNNHNKDDMITNFLEEDIDEQSEHDFKLVYSLMPELIDESIQEIKLFDFFQISGKIMNICEENCCFDFYCSNCIKNNSSMSKFNVDYHKLNDFKNKLMFDLEKK